MLPRIDKKRDDGLFAKDRGESSTNSRTHPLRAVCRLFAPVSSLRALVARHT